MPATIEKAAPAKTERPLLNDYPIWSPRFWHGMRFGDYLKLIGGNRLKIHPFRWAMAAALVGVTLFNSVMYRVQQLLYGRKIAEAEIPQAPIFIIGHWRSGTTHLHELLVRDDRFAFPTTYECFAPYHFLVTEWIVPRLTWFLLPRKRPMDNMTAGFDRPQEDEFAICAMGAPTPYVRMAFPNHGPRYLELLNMENVDPADLDRFKKALGYFVRALTVKKQKRLVMKSPPHTGRIALLAEMFPGARFVHLVRNPYALFPSMYRTWQALDLAQGFQIPHFAGLDRFILDCFQRMYRGFERQRQQIDPSHICDVRYEDLVDDPLGQVQRVYEQLELGNFEQVRPKLEQYVRRQRHYKPNRHALDPQIKQEIDERWAEYFERYGYDRE